MREEILEMKSKAQSANCTNLLQVTRSFNEEGGALTCHGMRCRAINNPFNLFENKNASVEI